MEDEALEKYRDQQRAKVHSLHMRTLRATTGMQPKLCRKPGGTEELQYPESKAVLETAGQLPILTHINEITLRMYGHLLRRPADFPAQRLMFSSPVGGVSYAWPLETWDKRVRQLMARCDLKDEEALERAV